jgi:HPt (histidine-containing phosphotransfer) domain-containing protein
MAEIASPKFLKVLKSGGSKLMGEDFAKLNAAYEEENYVTVKSVAHRMKSSLALAGEKELAALLNQLEEAPHFDEQTGELLARLFNEKSCLIERIEDQIEALR